MRETVVLVEHCAKGRAAAPFSCNRLAEGIRTALVVPVPVIPQVKWASPLPWVRPFRQHTQHAAQTGRPG